MIDTLSRLSMFDFIELLCGNREVLIEEGDNESMLENVASELIYQYQCIVNPSGVESEILYKEEKIKINYRITIAKILKALISINAVDDVVGLLSEMGITGIEREKIPARIDRMIAEAEYMRKRIEDTSSADRKKNTPDDVRASFDREIAFLMTYFKMNIDTRIITAGVYANMVHQADVEIKRKLHR